MVPDKTARDGVGLRKAAELGPVGIEELMLVCFSWVTPATEFAVHVRRPSCCLLCSLLSQAPLAKAATCACYPNSDHCMLWCRCASAAWPPPSPA